MPGPARPGSRGDLGGSYWGGSHWALISIFFCRCTTGIAMITVR